MNGRRTQSITKSLKLLLSCALLAIVLLAGCAADRPVLAVTREGKGGGSFVADFDRALFGRSDEGDIDIVLIADRSAIQPVKAPLSTSDRESLRQLLHVRMRWQPMRGLRLDNPSSSNATLSWYLIGSADDRIVYSGTCYARVDVDGRDADVQIRNAVVAISQRLGATRDPLRRARIEGEFTARRSDAAVAAYVEQLQAMTKPAVGDDRPDDPKSDNAADRSPERGN